MLRRSLAAAGPAVALPLLTGLIVLLGVAARPDAALGHSLLASSDPAAGATLATAPTTVTLTFTEPADPRLSSVEVLDAAGASQVAGPLTVTGDGTVMVVPLRPLPSGIYTVLWRSIAADEGHPTTGSFIFAVGTGVPMAEPGAGEDAPTEATGSSDVSLAAVAARTEFYLGVIVLVGALLVGRLAPRGRGGRLRAAAIGGWFVALVGSLSILVAVSIDAGVTVADVLASSLGAGSLGRIVPLLLAGPPLLAAGRPDSRRGPALAAVAFLALISLLADAASSHAAAAPAGPPSVLLQWAHIVAIAAWLGGLAGLLIELGGRDSADRDRAPLVERFSRIATLGIVTVAGTGVIRAASELQSPDNLLTTDYGRLVVVKAALLAAIAVLAATNHFRNARAGEEQIGLLRANGAGELLIGALVVAIASVLVTTAPPRAAAAPSTSVPDAFGVAVEGSDPGKSVRLRLTVAPAVAGTNGFDVSVADYATGVAAPATTVSLRFSLPARPEVETSTLALAAGAAGSFTGLGSNLSLAGTWSITALVAEPGMSVEVPLTLAVAAPGGAPPASPHGSPAVTAPPASSTASPGVSAAPGATATMEMGPMEMDGGPSAAASGDLSNWPRPSSAATLTVISPAEGQIVSGPVTRFEIALAGASVVDTAASAVRPDEGHVHLFVDGGLVAMSYSAAMELPLESGNHVLRAEFVAADHSPFDPPVETPEVRFTVRAGATASLDPGAIVGVMTLLALFLGLLWAIAGWLRQNRRRAS